VLNRNWVPCFSHWAMRQSIIPIISRRRGDR
jgi:hypothetical protein